MQSLCANLYLISSSYFRSHLDMQGSAKLKDSDVFVWEGHDPKVDRQRGVLICVCVCERERAS